MKPNYWKRSTHSTSSLETDWSKAPVAFATVPWRNWINNVDGEYIRYWMKRDFCLKITYIFFITYILFISLKGNLMQNFNFNKFLTFNFRGSNNRSMNADFWNIFISSNIFALFYFKNSAFRILIWMLRFSVDYIFILFAFSNSDIVERKFILSSYRTKGCE